MMYPILAQLARVSMSNQIPQCMGNYDFDEIADFAHQRFIQGVDTVSLISAAKSDREREEIALVSLLNVDDEAITAIELKCNHADMCRVTDCRKRLRALLETRLRMCLLGNHKRAS